MNSGGSEIVGGVNRPRKATDAHAVEIAQIIALKVRVIGAAFFAESAAFILCCTYLMFEYVRPQSIYPALELLPFAQITILAGTSLTLLERLASKKGIVGSQWALLVAYLSVAVLSLAISNHPVDGFATLQLLLTWYVAIYFISGSVTTERRFVLFYMLFLLFSFKMSQFGFRSWAQRGFSWDPIGVTGAPGWFNNSGEVGVQMCIFLPMMLHFMSAGWRQWGYLKRAVVSVVPITIIGTVLGSSSRGALIGSAAALMWMLMRAKRGKLQILSALIAVGAVCYWSIPPEFASRFNAIGQDDTSQLRLTYWKWGWETALDNPIFGIGIGNWEAEYANHLVSIGSKARVQLPHNIFILAASELGFVGLTLLLALIASTFVLNSRTRKLADRCENQFLRHCALGMDAGMIGYLVSAQFVTVLYYPYLWIGLAMTIALHNVAYWQAKAMTVSVVGASVSAAKATAERRTERRRN